MNRRRRPFRAVSSLRGSGRSHDAVHGAGAQGPSSNSQRRLPAHSALGGVAVVPLAAGPRGGVLARDDRGRLRPRAGSCHAGGEPVDDHPAGPASRAYVIDIDRKTTLVVVAAVPHVPFAVVPVAGVPVGRVRGVCAAAFVLVARVPTTLIVAAVVAVLAVAWLIAKDPT
jgi:hypothetical protein